MNEKREDLNTYVINRCDEHTLRYLGLKLIPTKSAKDELFKYRLTLQNCKAILESGYNTQRKRSTNTIEKWYNKGKKTYNIVILKDTNYFLNEDVWLIIHIGRFTRRKIK